LSSAVLFDSSDPLNPINRRISIIVLNKKAEDSITQENKKIEVSDKESAQEAVESAVNAQQQVKPAPVAPAAPVAPIAR